MPQKNPYEHITKVPCIGGPLGATKVAIYTWGKAPKVPDELPIRDKGTYRYDGGSYRWKATGDE